MLHRLTAIAALLIAGQAYAQSFIADTIPYSPEAKVADRIRQECTDLGTNFSRKIIEQAKAGGNPYVIAVTDELVTYENRNIGTARYGKNVLPQSHILTKRTHQFCCIQPKQACIVANETAGNGIAVHTGKLIILQSSNLTRTQLEPAGNITNRQPSGLARFPQTLTGTGPGVLHSI